MDDTVRTRLILLAVAGLLLIAGCLIWVNAHKSKEVMAEINAVLPVMGGKKPAPGLPGAKPVVGGVPGIPITPGSTGLPAAQPGVAVLPGGHVTNPGVAGAPGTPSGPVVPGVAVPGVQPGAAPSAIASKPGTIPQPQGAGVPPALTPTVPPTAGPRGATALNPNLPVPGSKPGMPGQPGTAPVPPQDVAVLPPPPPPPGVTAATSRTTALAMAKAAAGKCVNPCAAIKELKQFPRFKPAPEEEKELIPSPAEKKQKEVLVPPPPPDAEDALGSLPGGLSLDELPAPLVKPSLSEKMKLICVVGDRAILTFSDKALQRENKWPNTVTLGNGEKFESVSVVDVTPDSVTLDEDGERSVKNIDGIK